MGPSYMLADPWEVIYLDKIQIEEAYITRENHPPYSHFSWL